MNDFEINFSNNLFRSIIFEQFSHNSIPVLQNAGKRFSPSNYDPISFISKTFKVFKKKVADHLKNNNLLRKESLWFPLLRSPLQLSVVSLRIQ